MTEQSELHVEDIEEAARACRPVRSTVLGASGSAMPS